MTQDTMRAEFEASGFANRHPEFLSVWTAAWQAAVAVTRERDAERCETLNDVGPEDDPGLFFANAIRSQP